MRNVKFAVLLVACNPKYKGAAFCLIQAYQSLATSHGEAVLNNCDCALFELSNKVIATAACNEHQKSSFLCTPMLSNMPLEEGPTPVQIEREQMSQSCILYMTLVTIHIVTTGTVYCLHPYVEFN